MLTMQNKLTAVKDALLNVPVAVYHYTAPSDAKVPYIVWYEDGEASSLEANNHKSEQAIGGFVEYYTQTEFDSVVDDIQNALNSIELAWTYDDVIFGDPTIESSVIHHTWSWSYG